MNMRGYTKLFNSILASTIWREEDKTRLVWITMLAMGDRDGVVEGSIPGLADMARVSVEDCEKALECLMSPDKYSRTKDFDGKRIAETDGGWVILNHGKYREKMSEDERRVYNAKKQAEFRARQKEVSNSQSSSITVNDNKQESALSAHSESDLDSKEESFNTREVIEEWNDMAESSGLASCRLTSGRGATIRTRAKDPFWAENYMLAIRRIPESPFLLGTNDRGWRADFDFFLKPDTVTKIMEGKYVSSTPAEKPQAEGRL